MNLVVENLTPNREYSFDTILVEYKLLLRCMQMIKHNHKNMTMKVA